MIVEPGEAGFDPVRLARLGRFLDGEIAAGRVPGAVVGIVRGDATVLLTAHGFRDAATREPMPVDAQFWLASMTKPVTTVGALVLHEHGSLPLDVPVGLHLPEFADRRVADLDGRWDVGSPPPTRPAARQPTIIDLLRHTAGIPEGELGDTPVHALYRDAVGDGMTAFTGEEFLGRLAALPLLHDPGTTWHYGWGLDLTGQLVERITGRTLGEHLREHVFAPLGMRDTAFGAGDPARLAVPLPRDPDTGAPQALPDLTIARFHSGGAGLVGTVGDYLRFVSMLLGGGAGPGGHRVLGRATVEFMLADHLAPGVDVSRLWRPGWNAGHGFGLGLAVRRGVGGAATAGSPGDVTWPGAAGTSWWADPREGLGIVFGAHTPSPLQSRLQQQVHALVRQARV